jgi:hypothetical protein
LLLAIDCGLGMSRGKPAMNRRTFLRAAGGTALAWAAVRGAEDDPAFDPGQWLRRHKQGRLTVRTPQSGKPL